MKNPRKYTIEQLREAVATSISIRQTMTKLGIVEAGGNYATIRRMIARHNIDSSHFLGMGHYKGKTHRNTTRPLNEILVYGNYESTHRLKNRLIRDCIKTHQCEKCLRTEWEGDSIPLELHHKDGDRLNNRLDNIELLCPNCHAQTHNYRGKNKRKA